MHQDQLRRKLDVHWQCAGCLLQQGTPSMERTVLHAGSLLLSSLFITPNSEYAHENIFSCRLHTLVLKYRTTVLCDLPAGYIHYVVASHNKYWLWQHVWSAGYIQLLWSLLANIVVLLSKKKQIIWIQKWKKTMNYGVYLFRDQTTVPCETGG